VVHDYYSVRTHSTVFPSFSRSWSMILFWLEREGHEIMKISYHFEMDEVALTQFRVEASTRLLIIVWDQIEKA